ncbi:MAG TPA: ATP-binding protein, partial [Longimicrobium sp.]|nr:ATP-binding protein [Longimicrobium sp.]
RAAASDPAQVAAGRAQADRMRAVLAEVEAEERRLLGERTLRARALERRAGGLIVAGGLLAVVLAVATGVEILRRARRLRETAAAMEAEVERTRLATRAADRLARQNALILESAAEGIYGVDAQGYTTFLNPAAARMLGHPAEALIGRPYEATLLSQGTQGDPVRAALLSGEPRTASDATFRRADGSRFPVEFTCVPIVEERQIAGAVITFRDVAERREVDRMKDEFVSVVSHELRTPLTSIRGSLGLLAAGKAGEIPERGRRMLEIAVQNTDRLIRLINDILDLERIRSGGIGLERRRVDARELAWHAAEVMQAMAERAGVSLAVWAEEVAVDADADRILQVLTNLISNAVKFSPAGAAVEVTVERVGEVALFEVADRGRGIPPDRVEAIFEPFQQVDSSDARQKGGTGLGLAICRSLVEQHGGRIWAESEPGMGSTFSFTLPGADASPVAREALPPRAAGGYGRTESEARAPAAESGGEGAEACPPEGPCVLLAEDDEDLAKVLLEGFRRCGLEALHAKSGTEAMEIAGRAPLALLVLDPGLPEGDGFEVVRWMRDRPELAALPTLVYSARDLGEDERAEYTSVGRAASSGRSR